MTKKAKAPTETRAKSSSRSKRPYRKRKRAEAEEETRLRITEAAVRLHGTVGPARTKVTELAELAGVSRMTVYNHFPTEADLFQACSSHWESENPFPDPAAWLSQEDPALRLRAALVELYDWYDRKQGMLGNVLRDAPLLPSLSELMDESWGSFTDRMVGALMEGWSPDERDDGQLEAALHLVVDFHTWRTLNEVGSSAAADLAARMVLCAAATG